MVMDATQPQQPSPQSVGREFVRQYYTLLNKAPNHLHRFYNNNSSFIHGESTLVVGQKNIHNRIQQLNFHDCHAKISQVDAQATLGNGVVVQVTGELSNDGQPMRRFTQTFVLAAQSPKKYYVHNDIFRYQDLYSDEENDNELRSENDEDHEQQTQQGAVLAGNEPPSAQVAVGGIVAEQAPAAQPQPLSAAVIAASAGVLPQHAQGQQPVAQQQQPTIYYSLPAAGARPVPVLSAPQGAAVQIGTQFAAAAATGAGGVPAQVAAPSSAQLNGGIAHDDLVSASLANVGQQQQQAHVAPIVQQAASVPVVPAAVIATQAAPAGVTAVPLANVASIVQGGASGIPGFQQSPLMQQQLLQQQHAIVNAQQQQQAQAPNVAEIDESLSGVMLSNSNDVRVSEASPAPPAVDDFKTINEQQQQEKYEAAKQQQQQQNEPKTYANLFKSSSSTSASPSGFVNAAMQSQPPPMQQQPAGTVYQSSSTVTSSTYSQSDSSATPSSMSVYTNQRDSGSLRMDNNLGSNMQGGPLPQRNNSRINKDYEPRRTSNSQQFGDNQQLFLGNIPHHASEEELKALFSRFGTVLELRILSKPPGKVAPGVRNPLNYGFLTYDDPDSVQQCLASCPLYFPENAPDGQKLNVEEKKPRIRSDMPPRQSGMGMNNNMNNSQRNNMSGGPASRSLSNSGGGGGMMRGNNNSNMSRGGSTGGGGPRLGGAFNRNDNRGPSNGGGPPVRSGQNNAQAGGGSYGNRR